MNRLKEEPVAELARPHCRSSCGDRYETSAAPDESQPVQDEDDEIADLTGFTDQRYHHLVMASSTIGEMVDALKSSPARMPSLWKHQTAARVYARYPGPKQPLCCETQPAVA
jgi:hypothetical protein